MAAAYVGPGARSRLGNWRIRSTLLNILGWLDVPSDGRMFFRERELTGAAEDIRAIE